MLIRLAQTLSAEQAHRAAILGLRAAGGLMPPAPTHANLAIDCGLGRKCRHPLASLRVLTKTPKQSSARKNSALAH